MTTERLIDLIWDFCNRMPERREKYAPLLIAIKEYRGAKG